MTNDGRRLRGMRSREAILEQAVGLASVEGLDGLSLGRLATATGLSKSGFFAHWAGKEQLQLDAVGWATRQWTEHVVAPALRAPAGVRRLFALHEARLKFYSDGVLPGGCFFFTVQAEFDDRPGPVRDRVAQAAAEWQAFIQRQVTEAITLGELAEGTDPAQLAYEIDALGEMVIIHSRLHDGAHSLTHARRAVLQRLRALCPDPTLLPED
ncbi:TetR/AcrR family transcriptional regulator [Nonomuraea gerenzanensis]|uniref:Transcriptional regulator, TetR family n=1 Tax=Nonomuraea gerenzanensis TaxID=93944 RepID=A0A1M4EA30_9ACTN|nr:helix-turn-helix domain-containing protein [Nonomuraea gerenzanensis]UBU17911.1 TetR/AcrR family transcriptional regulator [Nonomuraea gerenzanensis]SBO95706.1 Transcriptional regulator, TetR family [Nonomuraea gerenzanensis]